MTTTRYILSTKSAETITLRENEAHIAKIRRVRRQLCVGEDVRKAA